MLQLRLAEGLNFAEYEEKFGEKITEEKFKKMKNDIMQHKMIKLRKLTYCHNTKQEPC